MTLLTYGRDRQLLIKIGTPNGLRQGAGLHRLTFPVDFDGRNKLGGGVSITINGTAWLGASKGDWLGPLLVDDQVVTHDSLPFMATLALALSDEQLAVIEQRRVNSDLTFWLEGELVLGYDPAVADGTTDERWPSKKFSEIVSATGETWTRLLSLAAAGMSLAVVVPVPLDASAAGRVGVHLRNAIAKVNDHEYEDAVTAARKAIYALDALGDGWASEKSVVEVPDRNDRTLDQRLAMLRHSLYSIACLAPHEDEVTVTVEWDREKALAVIAGVSALAACREARRA